MKEVDFYFDFSSTNSYFAAFLLPAICARHNARVNWMPIHLASMFRGTGYSVNAMVASRARYLWRDHQRWAQLTGLPFKRPSRFPIKTSAALRRALGVKRIAQTPGASDAGAAFAQAVFRAYWERDQDISSLAVLDAIASELRLDPVSLSALSDSAELRDELAALTESAINRGVFGAPTYFVGNEMFWGKDRLDFVERLLSCG